jgi:DHA1 family bicyclomycin/chloramphenicol resistance-like MFS transporter
VFAATAGSIEVLIAARFAQGLGGAAGMVIGRAIITDLAKGASAARAFSLLVIVGGVAPTLAPLLGGLLAGPLGWRGILWVVFGLATAMLLSVIFFVRETHHPSARSASFFPSGDTGLLSRAYVGNTLVFALSFGVMMAYISASPFVYQVMMGLSPTGYGVLFGINSIGLISASSVSARLVERVGPERILRVGMTTLVASTLVLLAFVLLGLPAWSFAFPIFTTIASMGLVLGNATGLALTAVPRAAGAGSAILGAGQFGIAAVASPLVNLAGEASAVPLAIVMVSFAAAAAVALLVSRGSLTARTR